MNAKISTQFPHQYVERHSGRIVDERLIADRQVAFLYNSLRENAPAMFRALTSARISSLLGFCQYDSHRYGTAQIKNAFARLGIDPQECVEPLSHFTTMRRIFERQIRYWQLRPMDDDPAVVVSPADARLLIGSFKATSRLFIKEKYFDVGELLGRSSRWCEHFVDGDFAVCRLTPDKYHYNHFPVSGRVVDIYEVDGAFHSCNPLASIAIASIYSKNRRVVTIIDTNVEGGSQVDLVVMVEVVALMIGKVVQSYSHQAYADPVAVEPGLFVSKGCPKSLYRPGSSTDIVIFKAGKIEFSADLIGNSRRRDVQSRFSQGAGTPLVETDIRVRSSLARRK